MHGFDYMASKPYIYCKLIFERMLSLYSKVSFIEKRCCAVATQNQRSNWFCAAFFGGAKKYKSLIF